MENSPSAKDATNRREKGSDGDEDDKTDDATLNHWRRRNSDRRHASASDCCKTRRTTDGDKFGDDDTKHGETERLWSGTRQADAAERMANGLATGVKEDAASTYFRLRNIGNPGSGSPMKES